METTFILAIAGIILLVSLGITSLFLSKFWAFTASIFATGIIILIILPMTPLPQLYPDTKCTIENEETLNGLIKFYTCEQYEHSYNPRYFAYFTYIPYGNEKEILFEHLMYGAATVSPISYKNPNESIFYISEYRYGDTMKFTVLTQNKTESRLIKFY